METPPSFTARVTLTKANLSTEHGKELVRLILDIGLDGEISDAELGRLAVWLKSAPQGIPAIRHLSELVSDALNDGFISDEERKILHKQIERVLPLSERERVALARKSLQEKQKSEQQKHEQREKTERDDARKEEREKRRHEDNMPTEAQLRYIKSLGGSLPIGATKFDASALIERLLHSNTSISERQKMVLRFWKITPEPHWGKAQVSVWMDQWYEGDPDRQLAWELFKEENRDAGLSQNPERVPIGSGYAYLEKIRNGHGGSAEKSSLSKGGRWLFLAIVGVLGVVSWLVLFPRKSVDRPILPPQEIVSVSRQVEQSDQTTPSKPALAEPKSPANESALMFAQARFGQKPLQIPATVIDVGILKYVPYLSYRLGNDRELNIYGDPESPACVEVGLYRALLSSNEEKKQCVSLISALFPDLDFGPIKPNGGKILSKGGWVIEVTMPDSPDAYGGWWISVYSQEKLHGAQGTVTNVDSVSEPISKSAEWDEKQLSYARPQIPTNKPVAASPTTTYPVQASSDTSSGYSYSPSSYSSGRVYVKSYTRKDGTYVRSHSRRK